MSSLLTPGSNLGRYRLDRVLGRGASGVVYLAHDTTLETDVALKVLSMQGMDQEVAWERFRRELLLARRLSHPGICRVFDLHVEGETRFITMEYVAGQTLEEILDHENIIEVARAVRLVRAICRALRVAHRAGVLHRDLKPMNIMVDTQGRPVILDFGFATARDVRGVTQAGFALGSPHYMAPELFEGQPASPQSDLYSLGALLYRSVTGQVPFPGENLLAVAQAATRGTARAASALNPNVSAPLTAILDKVLARTPGERYEHVDAFEAALAEQAGMIEVSPEVTVIVRSPTHGNIEHTVVKMMEEASFSQMIRSRIAPKTILFSDIVSITSYFDQFGDVLGRKRIETHNNLLFPIVEDHDGTVVKTIGDAIMASFPDANCGVSAAVEMQRTLEAHNATVGADDQISIRIGLHSGEAIVEDKDVFGNTVNVAARIAAKAQGAQILISTETHEALTALTELVQLHSKTELKGKGGTFTLYSVSWGPAAISNPALEVTSTRIESTQRVRVEKTQPGISITEPRIDAGPVDATRRLWILASVAVVLSATAAIAIALLSLNRRNAHVSTAPSHSEEPKHNSPPLADAGTTGSAGVQPAPSPPARLPAPSPTATAMRNESRPSVTPSREPRPSAASDARTQRREGYAHELESGLTQAMRDKGLVDGDSGELDRTRRRFTFSMKKNQWDDAITAGEHALELIDAVSIDEGFVASKLTRFNERFDRVKGRAVRKKLEPIVDQIMAAVSAGDQRVANRQLNRAFQVLDASH